MSNEDAQRWNRRYLADERFAENVAPRPFLVDNFHHLPKMGLALDVAAGLGGNAGYLLERGFLVIAVDISSVAIQRAKERFPELMAVLADLNHFNLPENHFNLILNFFYLQIDLWPKYRRALHPGGVLVYESLTRDMLEVNPDMDVNYLLRRGELLEAFVDWHVLVYEEGWIPGHSKKSRAVARLVAQKPE